MEIKKILEKGKRGLTDKEIIDMKKWARVTTYKKIKEETKDRNVIRAVSIKERSGNKSKYPTSVSILPEWSRVIRFKPIMAGGTADSFCFNMYDEVGSINLLTNTVSGIIEIDKSLFESGQAKII